MTKSKETEIGSVKEFLEIFEELYESYKSGVVNNPVSTKFIFRGVCDENYQLLPNFFRKDKSGNKKYLWGNDDLSVLKDFIIEASSVVKGIQPTEFNRWAEYAQHYGVPTRFLDWTTNPLVALYFACLESNTERPIKNSALWILNVRNYISYTNEKFKTTEALHQYKGKSNYELIKLLLSGEPACDYPILYQPYYVDQRMSAQSSVFMVWGNKTESLKELIPKKNKMILSNKDSEGERTYGLLQEEGIILKLVIPKTQRKSILRQLDMMGINEKALFPGLDGIGKYIEAKYRFNYDEAIDML